MQLSLKIAAYAGILLVLLFLALWVFQRRLIYFPDPTRHPPASLGLAGVEEVVLNRPNGVRIVNWYSTAQPSRPTLLYFHGNGGNLAARAERIELYRESGLGVFMMSYRGYSGSTGTPSEAANVGDALAAFDELVRRGVPENAIILYGESLGSGVAVQVAGARRVAGIILDAPFTSLADVGARVYPFLPVRYAIADTYDSKSRIADIAGPLLIVHGEQDQVVPHDMGRALFDAARQPKTFASIPEAGHSDHYAYGSFKLIHDWIAQMPRSSP